MKNIIAVIIELGYTIITLKDSVTFIGNKQPECEQWTNEYTKIESGIKRGCIFSLDLFNPHNKMTLRKQDLSGFIIGGHKLNNVGYVEETLLMANPKRTRQ